MSQARNLLEIWDLYSKQVLVEKKSTKPAKFGTKKGPGPADINSKQAQEMMNKSTSGPLAAQTLQTPVDVKNPKDVKANTLNIKGLSIHDENFDQSMEKTTKAVINNNMKSIFDKLFEEVVNSEDAADLDALGIDADKAGGSDESGDITVTLTSDQVECLRAILSQVDGGDDEMGGDDEVTVGGEGDEGDESMPQEDEETKKPSDEEEDEETVVIKREATEMKEVPDSAGQALTKPGHIVVGDKTKKLTKKGPGDKGKLPAPDAGSDLPDSHGAGLTKHNNNKPASKIKGGNQEFFGV